MDTCWSPPNVFRLQHLLYMMGGRHNLFHPYSATGLWPPSREYGMGELIDLVQGCGYSVIQAEIANFEPSTPWAERSVKRLWRIGGITCFYWLSDKPFDAIIIHRGYTSLLKGYSTS